MAIVKKYRAVVSSVSNPIDGLYTVEFRSLDRSFRYKPGQFMHLALEVSDPSEHWPDSRCFSMQSSPDEENIRITYAIKGHFTKKMEAVLHAGKEVLLKLPYGNLFTQPHGKTHTVFIAGGTGITPFLSLFAHPSFADYSRPILFAGFRNRQMNLYAKELQVAQVINPGFSCHLTYEDEQGELNIDQIYKQSIAGATFFISGPPGMIKGFKTFLLAGGVDQSNVLTDDWE